MNERRLRESISQDNQARMAEVKGTFGDTGHLVLLLYAAKEWEAEPRELNKIKPGTVAKTVRRGFDRLGRCGIAAVATIDAMWRPGSSWQVFVKALVASDATYDYRSVFNRGAVSATEVHGRIVETDDPFKEYKNGERPPMGLVRAAERYCWRDEAPSGSLTFRYGLDRHLTLIEKDAMLPRPSKGHPYPRWLQPCFYGSHLDWCDCRICKGWRRDPPQKKW